MTMTKVKPRNLVPGDELASGVYVTGVWHDPEGTWLETSDGDAGYVHDEERPFRVASYN
jgi:hypothetical protein